MKKLSIMIVALVLVIVFGSYMIIFQVRYDEVAVLATFDHADAEDSIYDKPGPHFKWPRPIQKVYRYSQKLQILEDQLEELQTSDGYAVILNMFIGWRIENPYDFHRATLGNVKKAENQLVPLLRDLKGIISKYPFTALVNTDPEKLKLQDIEDECAKQLSNKLGEISPSYGIKIETVGIRKLVLPEATTQKVFDRMRTTRERMAEKARAEGKAAAATIRSEASSAQQRILAFAERRAQGIRALGDREAAEYYEVFKQDEEFAKFLRRMQTLRLILDNNTTFMIDAKDLDMLNIMDSAPGVGNLAPAAAAPGPSAGASTN
jgi:membrane protease subunit HflC